MKSAILLVVATAGLCGALPALGQETAASPAGPIEVIRSSDPAMGCAAMADEAALLSQTMGGEPCGGLFGRLGGVARAGAALLIPGAGLVMAGTDALAAPDRDRKAAEVAAVRDRWYYLNGLYAGRDGMNAASAAAAPVAPASPAPAPAVPGV